MIPKRAIFYWEGKPMSWLRQQAFNTFRFLNPDWEVVQITGSPTTSFVARVQQSDRARYKELYERGGIYFDTDMVFVRPVPPAWLEPSMILPIDVEERQKTLYGIALLGSEPGHPFWKSCVEWSERLAEDSRIQNPQAFGIRLVGDVLKSVSSDDRKSILALPHTTHMMVDCMNIERLWWDIPLQLSSDTIAVHWYGGDRVSEEMEALGENLPECQVRKALRMAMRVAA